MIDREKGGPRYYTVWCNVAVPNYFDPLFPIAPHVDSLQQIMKYLLHFTVEHTFF